MWAFNVKVDNWISKSVSHVYRKGYSWYFQCTPMQRACVCS